MCVANAAGIGYNKHNPTQQRNAANSVKKEVFRMFELDIEMLKEQGMQLVDSAKKTAQDLAGKGKNQLDLLNQQARLS